MKLIALFTGALLVANVATHAQVADDVKKTAKDVGNKTAQTTVKTTSSVVDNKYQDKVGKNGETIFIDHHSKYYYVNEKGKKVYVKKSYLKDKPKD